MNILKKIVIIVIIFFFNNSLASKENLNLINIKDLQKLKTKEIERLLIGNVATGYFHANVMNGLDFVEVHKQDGSGRVVVTGNRSFSFSYKIQGSKISYNYGDGWEQVRLFQKKEDSQRNGEYYILQKNRIIAKITKLQTIEEYEIAVQQQIEREKKEAEEKRLAEEKREKERIEREKKEAEEKRLVKEKNKEGDAFIEKNNIDLNNLTGSLWALENVNLRTTPDTNSKKIRVIQEGSKIKVVGSLEFNNQKWYKIKADNYLFGYSMSKFFSWSKPVSITDIRRMVMAKEYGNYWSRDCNHAYIPGFSLVDSNNAHLYMGSEHMQTVTYEIKKSKTIAQGKFAFDLIYFLEGRPVMKQTFVMLFDDVLKLIDYVGLDPGNKASHKKTKESFQKNGWPTYQICQKTPEVCIYEFNSCVKKISPIYNSAVNTIVRAAQNVLDFNRNEFCEWSNDIIKYTLEGYANSSGATCEK